MVPKAVTLERVSHRPISAVLDSLQLPEASVVAFLKGVLRVGDVTGTWRALVSVRLGGRAQGGVGLAGAGCQAPPLVLALDTWTHIWR